MSAEPARPRRFFLSAGEASGDLHASNLLKALARLSPGAEFAALGGERLAGAGAELLFDMTARFSVMGLSDALRIVPAVRSVRDGALAFLDEWGPDAAVLVDYPGFNVNLAKHLKRRGIPVFYYICPQVWAWAPWRARKIRRRIDRALVVFDFEEELYEGAPLGAEYVGHPLGDVFAACELDEEFLENGPLSGARLLVSLLPGSRRREVERGFPVKVAAARRISETLPGAQFAAPVVSREHAELVERIAADGGLSCSVFVGKTYEVMRLSRFALATSGTATLELARFRVPMVVLYRTNPAGVALKRLVLTTPHVALVNIVAGRRIVPELVYWRNRAAAIADMALEVLSDEARYEGMKADIDSVARVIEGPGASQNAARRILADLEGCRPRAVRANGPPRAGL